MVTPKAETCPQCGNKTLMIIAGAKRPSCSLCNYIQPDKNEPPPPPFQGHMAGRRKIKRKRVIHVSTYLWRLLILVGLYGGYHYVMNQESEDLEGFRALERSYNTVTRMITADALKTAESRTRLQLLIKREKTVVSHLPVSPCLNPPRSYLAHVYGIFENGLANNQYDFKNNRRVLSLSSKFVNGVMECKDTYAPHQFTLLKLHTNYPDGR
jgi:ribosomal protein S27AE